MQPHSVQQPRSRRARRWLIGLTVVLVLLVAYAFGLRWLVQRVETGVMDHLDVIPAAREDQRQPLR